MTEIAFLGIGLMGRPMAERLIDAGYRLFLFNRTRSKILDLEGRGAVIADSPGDAIRQAQVVILMLSDYQAVQNTLMQGGELSCADRTFIQMGTILPRESHDLKVFIERQGGSYMECPVLGSRDKARTGELILMVGSTKEQFERVSPLLGVLGLSLRHVGEVGQAAALKLALNQLIITLAASFSLSLGMVLREGVCVEDFMAILKESALYAPTFDKKLPRLLSRDFSDPNFPVRHMLKDVRLILQQAKHSGLDASLLIMLENLLTRAVDQGLADQDYSAVYRVLNPQ
jgi:3-hydroxyisobutyrate dehydrogenase-like beta-hydroxyacid dehydrogenase